MPRTRRTAIAIAIEEHNPADQKRLFCPTALDSRRSGRAKIAPEELRAAEPPKRRGPARSQPLQLYSHLALGDDRRRGFTLADASAARDAEESKHRSRC